MLEYKANGVRLGLLVDPKGRQVEIYRIDREVEILENPGAIDCNNILPGFTLDLQKIWS
jgi:Uma2 family endonuclease